MTELKKNHSAAAWEYFVSLGRNAYLLPVDDITLAFKAGAESRDEEIEALHRERSRYHDVPRMQIQADEIRRLREALKELIDTVDESLLLDEDLAQDWDKLHQAVIKARSQTKGE